MDNLGLEIAWAAFCRPQSTHRPSSAVIPGLTRDPQNFVNIKGIEVGARNDELEADSLNLLTSISVLYGRYAGGKDAAPTGVYCNSVSLNRRKFKES